MGKRRKSGKSGARPSKTAGLPDAVSDNEDGDVIGSGNLHGDEIDDFYDQEDNALSLKLNRSSKSNRTSDDVNEVFGLSDSDDDFIESHSKKKQKKKVRETAEVEGDDFDAEETAGSWGQKKQFFYGGNPNERPTSKFRQGKEKEKDNDENELNEAEAEEKESRFLQEKQLQNLNDEDFLFDVYGMTGSGKKKKTSTETKENVDKDLENVKLDLSKLSRREKVRLFERECPEFSLIVGDFDRRMREIGQTYQPLVDLMKEGTLPSEGPAAEYIKLKHQLAVNYGVNIACYLMFKSRKVDLKMHPLTARLVGYKNILDDLEKKLDPIVMPQIKEILEIIGEEGGLHKLKKLVGKANRAEPEKKKKPTSKRPKKTLQLLKNASKESDDVDATTLNQINEFTPDEAMAIEMMSARKSKKKGKKDSDSEDSEPEEEEEQVGDDKVDDDDDEKRRSITYEMSKNKGLMPKRSKLQRNPRVKHRVKYEKAKIKRKGQIREVRKEVKKYAGEMSGINKRVKKGIKLA